MTDPFLGGRNGPPPRQVEPPELLPRVTLRYNFRDREGGDWDETTYRTSFVPRIGDEVYVPELGRDLPVRRVVAHLPNDGAATPRLWVFVELYE